MRVSFSNFVLNVIEEKGVHVMPTLTFFHIANHQIFVDVLLNEVKKGNVQSFELHADSIKVSAFTKNVDIIWKD